MKRFFAAAAALAAIAFPCLANAQELRAWVVGEGSGHVEFTFIRQEAPISLRGTTPRDLNPDFSQNTYLISDSYGVTDRFMIDGRIGYSTTVFPVGPSSPDGGNEGISDARIGLTYLLVDETRGAPVSLTASVAAIAAGDYDPSFADGIGDGASGAEVGIAIGRVFANGISVSAQSGGRFRAENVPVEFFLGGTVAYQATSRISTFVSMGWQNSFGDLDLGTPQFTSRTLFPQLEEDFGSFTVGTSIQLVKGLYLRGSYGRKFEGRNTTIGGFYFIGLGYAF